MKTTAEFYPRESFDESRILACENAKKEYTLTDAAAVTLLRQAYETGGPDYFINLFSQFIGLANSVAENCKEAAGDFLLQYGADIHPHQLEQLNMPSIYGALNGVRLANAVGDAKTCAGCAYRKGTWANQCASTTIDAEHCQTEGSDFLCHADLGPGGEPQHKCIGYATFIKQNPKV